MLFYSKNGSLIAPSRIDENDAFEIGSTDKIKTNVSNIKERKDLPEDHISSKRIVSSTVACKVFSRNKSSPVSPTNITSNAKEEPIYVS